MLTKPDIKDELIISRLHDEYNLHVSTLIFLPLGADMGTVVYRAVADDETAYFLKLRKGFNEITVTVPIFLKAQGVQAVIVPFETRSKGYWTDFGEYKMILYPFVEGENSFEMGLEDEHKKDLGMTLRRIHAAQIPPELGSQIPQETFSPQARERLKSLQQLAEHRTFDEPTAASLAGFMKLKQKEIAHLLARADKFASELRSGALNFVLCHSDLHRANVLIGDKRELYIVDWDEVVLAHKERDLMFIGGGIDNIWKSPRDKEVFYQGYGSTEINLTALAYFRYERIVEDLAIIGEQLLWTDEGGADRERSYGWFKSNFEPGSTIEIANMTNVG